MTLLLLGLSLAPLLAAPGVAPPEALGPRHAPQVSSVRRGGLPSTTPDTNREGPRPAPIPRDHTLCPCPAETQSAPLISVVYPRPLCSCPTLRDPHPAKGTAPRSILPAPFDRAQEPEGAACLLALERLGVSHRVAPHTRGVATPVVLTGPLGGVRYTPHWDRVEALMDCQFALTLHRLAPVIRAAGFDEVRFSSFYSYRTVSGSRRLSRHANGLAVDIHELRGPNGAKAHIQRDWRRHHGAPDACQAPFPPSPEGRLRQVVCGLEASGLIYLVLTPDSDAAHYNHLHVSGLRSGDRPPKGRVAGVRVR